MSAVKSKVYSLRFLFALLFVPRNLRDATVRAWAKELEMQALEASWVYRHDRLQEALRRRTSSRGKR